MSGERRRNLDESLRDALDAADRIAEWTAGRTLDDYRNDEFLRSAVERKFEVIGEAMRTVDGIDRSYRQLIPELGEVIGMRNAIAHGYFLVNDGVVWSAVTSFLPRLRHTIAQLIGEQP